MFEIMDEFKIIIVEVICMFCFKFFSKQVGMFQFFSGVLCDEGGYEFKCVVVESMFDLIKFVFELKEEVFVYLCEFIEDCEFIKFVVCILYFFGVEGFKILQFIKYIWYIYNCVVFENVFVCVVVVIVLVKFGVGQKDFEVKCSVDVLFICCLDDVDDEVCDCVVFNFSLMYEEDELVMRFVKNDSMFFFLYFEYQFVMYVIFDDKFVFDDFFDVFKILIVIWEQVDVEDRMKKFMVIILLFKLLKIGFIKVVFLVVDVVVFVMVIV